MNGDKITGTVLAAVKDAVPPPHMHIPVQQILAAAQSHRRRRRLASLAGAALAAGIGLATAFTAVGADSAVTAPRHSDVRLAAWTVRTDPDGTVIVTLRQLFNAPDLQRVLAEHGVPAIVHFGVMCDPATGTSLPQITKVLGLSDRSPAAGPSSHNPIMLRIHPAAMPKSSKLDFSVFGGSTAIQLLPAGVGVNCHAPASSHTGPSTRSPATG